jgi:hypothetical protein
MVKALAVGVHLVVGDGRYVGEIYFFWRTAVPILGGDGEGIVGMGEGYQEHKRPIISAAGQIMKFALGLEGNLFVEVELVAGLAHTCLNDAQHVMVPGGPGLKILPIRGPAEVGRINIGR